MTWTLALVAWGIAGQAVAPTSPALLAPAVPDPAALVTRMADAIESRDDRLAEALFASGAYRRGPDSGERFFGQAVAKQFVLTLRSTLVADDRRARVVVDVLLGGKPVDRVYFWAQRENGLWRIGAINEDKYFAQPFLDGLLPVDFFIGAQRGTTDLDRLGLRLRERASGPEGERGELGVENAESLKRLADAPTLAFKSTHLANELGCAVLLFQAPPAAPGAFADSLSFVLTRRGGTGWKIASYAYAPPSNEAFLRACTKGAGTFPTP
jgi:hypothetical protein